MSDLVDEATVRKFCALLHERAAAALTGVEDPTAVIQLCRMLPDEARMLSQGFHVGDAAHMAEAAIDYASAGFNVYVEGRTVRPETTGVAPLPRRAASSPWWSSAMGTPARPAARCRASRRL